MELEPTLNLQRKKAKNVYKAINGNFMNLYKKKSLEFPK